MLVDDQGIEGYTVWEMFTAAWADSPDTSTHVCAQVSAFVGEESGEALECDGCERQFTLLSELLDTDCPEGIGGEDFGRPTHLGLGAVPKALRAEDPGEGSLGWYLSWDGESTEPVGFAWQDPASTGASSEWEWGEGLRLQLDSPYGWKL